MATLQKIRNRGTMLMLIIGLALLTFIFTAAIRNSSKSVGQEANIMGEVDGEPIYYQAFRKDVGLKIQAAEAQRGRLTSQQRDAIELQAWNELVRKVILGKQMEELGVVVTADELSHIFSNKTDVAVQSAFQGATPEQIVAQISQIENSNNAELKNRLNNFKQYVEDKRLNDKYFALLSQGLKVDSSLIAGSFVAGKVDFNYVRKTYSSIKDSLVTITDAEIKKYYDAHKELFKQVPSREVAYVKIDVEPSAEDKEFALKSITELKSKFAVSKIPMRFASVNSEVHPNVRFYTKEDIKNIELANFAFSKDNKGVYGPYGTGNILQISRVTATKMLPDSVRASHILIAPSATTKATVDSLFSLLKKGADFEKIAKANSVDKGSAVNGGDLGWFSKGRMVPTFEEVAFDTPKGDIAIAQSQFGTHIIKVTERAKLHENVQLATIVRETTPSNKTFQLALTEARHIAESVANISELKAAAKEKNLIVNETIFTAASMGIRGVDNSKALVRAAFKAEKENELIVSEGNSTVFDMDGSYIIAGLTKKVDRKYASLEDEKAKDFIKSQLKKTKKAVLLKKEFSEAMGAVNSLEALAEKESISVQEAKNATFANSFVAGLGQEPAVVAEALLDAKDGMSKPIEGNSGVFVIANIKKDMSQDSKTELEQSLARYNQMLQQRVQMAYQALFENAEVTDERYRF